MRMKSGGFSFHLLTYSVWGMLAATAFSGVFLAVYYLPNFSQAFSSLQRVDEQVPFGWMFRRLHAAGGSLLLLLFLIHLLRVFYAGEYKVRPGWVWVAEVLLIFFTLWANCTGFFLPLSREAYWGTASVLSSVSTLPAVGKFLAEFLRGGRELGGAALARFFAMHIGFAALAALLLFGHSRRGFSEDRAKNREFRSPNLWVFAAAAGVLLAVITFLPFWFADPLREAANTAINPAATSLPWYLAFFQETLSYFNAAHPVLPVLFFGAVPVLVLLLPYIDRTAERKFLLRPVALSLGSAVLAVGVYFTLLGMAGADYGGRLVVPQGPLSAAEVRGARVFGEKNCAYCHQVFGRNGRREGPDMAVVLQRNRSPEWIQRFILNARLYQPGTTMPRYEIPLEDLEGLSAYLLSLDPKRRKLQAVDRDFLSSFDLFSSEEALKK
jgi:quinol-cytochrome oxidoreductase complex cytochrome b subunit